MSKSNFPLVICLMGPTASGKTDWAMRLYDLFPVELISVDSAMIYKDFDIGSAKPDKKTLARYPHHLVDILSANEHFSVADFIHHCRELIDESINKGKIPLLVGGTMMYFKALMEGLSDLPEKNLLLRQELMQIVEKKGLSALHDELKMRCPDSAIRIHPNDPQRLIRAVEVCRLSGQSMTALFAKREKPLANFEVVSIGLMPETRAWLHQRLEKRFLMMLEEGLLQEVEAILAKGVKKDAPAMKMIGYKEACAYLQGESTKEEMIAKASAATRQLAKRQLTWLRQWPKLQTFTAGKEEDLISLTRLLQKHIG